MGHQVPPRIPLPLRQRLAGLARPVAPMRRGDITLGLAELDDWLGGGLARGGLHEVFATGQADVAAAMGFAALLALRAARQRRILWVRQDFLDGQTGRLHPPGLAGLGLNPALVVLVRAGDVLGVLRAAGEAARCNGLGAVLVEPWGEAPLLDHSTSRRLSLAAEGSGVPVLMLRVAATPTASAAASRWLVGALPSRPLAANAPGPPAFAATLLRHRGGAAGATWHLEWNHEQQRFQAHDTTPLPRAVVPVPAGRPAGLDQKGREWAGGWSADRRAG
ncbi:MAG: hypothetical protein BGP12_15570 [Rhodospirillales bacterium 70-18]|nr:MAG: hypothetical protein BGP12_15570 [Rhodospirillales bacterium 70-18]